MSYEVEWMECKLFNWCGGVLTNLKDQFNSCNTRKNNQFGYGSLLIPLFLERVPLLYPHIHINVHPSSESRMETCTSFSARLRVDHPIFYFDVEFFNWWKKMFPMI
jgi:hypothetical protein